MAGIENRRRREERLRSGKATSEADQLVARTASVGILSGNFLWEALPVRPRGAIAWPIFGRSKEGPFRLALGTSLGSPAQNGQDPRLLRL